MRSSTRQRLEEKLKRNQDLRYMEEEARKIITPAIEKKLKEIKSPLKEFMPVNFKSTKTVTVLQGEYAITKADSERPILGSYGAASCLLVALYDEKNKIASFAHTDTVTLITSLEILLKSMSKENTVGHLFGGELFVADFCIEVVNFLQEHNIKIVNADIARDPAAPNYSFASLAIDARTGQIYSPVRAKQLSIRFDIQEDRPVLGQVPLRECYNGLRKINLQAKVPPVIKISTSKSLEEKESQASPSNLKVLSKKQPTIVIPPSDPISSEEKGDQLQLSPTSPSSLGLLAKKKQQLPKKQVAKKQPEGYCGFKPGFLGGKS